MRMTRRQTQLSVQVGSHNVYADLGFRNPDGMLRKARIASEISATLKKAGLAQIAAARRIRVPRATFLRVMRGEFTQVAERTLKRWLARFCETRLSLSCLGASRGMPLLRAARALPVSSLAVHSRTSLIATSSASYALRTHRIPCSSIVISPQLPPPPFIAFVALTSAVAEAGVRV